MPIELGLFVVIVGVLAVFAYHQPRWRWHSFDFDDIATLGPGSARVRLRSRSTHGIRAEITGPDEDGTYLFWIIAD